MSQALTGITQMCAHRFTIVEGCSACLGPDDWYVVNVLPETHWPPLRYDSAGLLEVGGFFSIKRDGCQTSHHDEALLIAELSMCWGCGYAAVSPDDDLGLCIRCIKQMRTGEPTIDAKHWTGHRTNYGLGMP